MPYASISDVQNLIKWTTFTHTSTVTRQQISRELENADAEINSRIGRLYQVPVEDENDRKLLAYISARLTAYEIAKILVAQAGGELPEVVVQWKNSAEERLGKIINEELVLQNTDTRMERADGLSSGMKGKEPVWKKGVDQW